ncbi:MAG: helix-turn-helix transcriptional regulator [Pseudomonadota bacterium]
MRTHEELKTIAVSRPSVRSEYELIGCEEMPMQEAILAARKEAVLTQVQVAERMGTKAPAVTRLENALITGSPSPSFATLRKYAAVLGKRVEIRLVTCDEG